jgi:hypothetical protein
MKKALFIALILGLVVFHSCKKETESFELSGQEYAAERTGKVLLYRVDSQIFNLNTAFDSNYTITFFERHVTKEIQIDSTGKPYFYHQVHKSADRIDWIPSYAYKTYIDSTNYTKVVDNKKVIHLSLPINTFKTWDGNIFNDEKGGQQFRYIENDNLMQPDSIFKDQITVRLKKELLPLTESYAYFESYAPKIGLVYKYKYFNDIQIGSNNIISQSGHHLHYNLIGHN